VSDAHGLELVGLTKRFDALEVLRGIDLSVASGSIVALLGPSGSGKTTVLRILAGFERADAGTVRVGDTVVDDGHHALAPERRRVGYVPQEGALFPHMTVGHNIGFGLPKRRDRPSARERVRELIEMVGLQGLGRRYPHQLSGGQQQRVALARALAVRPSVILLDEPFSSLDAGLRASVRADVLDVLRRAGTTALLVTHDQDEALSSADAVAVLVGGRIMQCGTPRDLYSHPRSPEVARFLGASNLLGGDFEGAGVRTELGVHEMAAGAGPGRGRATVLVRPEQLEVVDVAHTEAHFGHVVYCEFFGHDLVVRVAPDRDETAPPLVARVAGDRSLPPGLPVRVFARGSVVAWPRADPEPAEPRESAPASKNTSM